MDDDGVDLAHETQVDLVGSDERRAHPDVVEGYNGEVAPPTHHDAARAEGGGQAVAQRLPKVEALEGALPAAVQAAGVVRLTDELLPAHLKGKEREQGIRLILWSYMSYEVTTEMVTGSWVYFTTSCGKSLNISLLFFSISRRMF